MFSRNFIIYNADVTERETSKFYNSAERKRFSGLVSCSLNEEVDQFIENNFSPAGKTYDWLPQFFKLTKSKKQ